MSREAFVAAGAAAILYDRLIAVMPVRMSIRTRTCPYVQYRGGYLRRRSYF